MPAWAMKVKTNRTAVITDITCSAKRRADVAALALEAAGILGHEGGVEGALREQAAEQVGEALGDEEGVGRQPGAEGVGDEDVADEAEHPARQRVAADGEDGGEEIHGPRCLASNRGVAKAGDGAALPLHVMPAKAGIQGGQTERLPWTPAFAGVTTERMRIRTMHPMPSGDSGRGLGRAVAGMGGGHSRI